MQRDGGPGAGGPGAGGNPTGGSFTGAAETLEIIGDHAYCFSGAFESVDGSQTMLSFSTGNFYTVGEFTFNGPVRFAGASAGGIAVYQISFNDTVVALGKADTNAPDYIYQGRQKVIIAPYTQVVFKARCDEDTNIELITATFTGRIYRG